MVEVNGPVGQRIPLWQAIKDIGWMPVAFASIAGLSIFSTFEIFFGLEIVVPELRWMLDGYKRIVELIGAIFEPPLYKLFGWLQLDVKFYPIWRAYFALLMCFHYLAFAPMRAIKGSSGTVGALLKM